MADWVEYESYPFQTQPSQDVAVSDGVCRLLFDTQVNLNGPVQVQYHRTVQRVQTRAGAERVAHFVAEFDPAYGWIEVHFIRIWREQACIEHAEPNAFQTFRRENNLDRLALNGRLTTSLLIPDVRVEDIVEIGLTIYGSNPALGGKYVAWTVFDPFHPWIEARHRLLRPSTRDIHIKPFNDPPERKVTVRDGIEDSRWRAIGKERRAAEPLTPPWLMLAPTLQYSEFASWSEVAHLFAPHYENPDIPATLLEEIDRLTAAYANPADRAIEWLRFVQQKLRYFALSLGDGGLLPRTLGVIWGSRFGDCKDAARLYLAGARRMGLEACAALVSTTHGPSLDEFLPSPNIFDHCIVRLRLNGKSYWLDPTMQTQGGSLENVFQPQAGWSLPLTPETTQLEKLDESASLHYANWEDDVHFGLKPESPATLLRSSEFFHWAADSVRNRIANEGAAEYAKERLKELQTIWPEVREIAPMVIEDDLVENCLITTNRYEISDCWKPTQDGQYLGFETIDMTLAQELGPLQGNRRWEEIYLGRPRKRTRRIRLHMPCRWAGDGWCRAQQMPGVSYVYRLQIEGSTLVLSKELIIEAWSIPAVHADDYQALTGALAENKTTILARERFGKIRSPVTRRFDFDFNINFDGLKVVIFLMWLLAMLVGALHR